MALRTGAGFLVRTSQGARLFLLHASRAGLKHSRRLREVDARWCSHVVCRLPRPSLTPPASALLLVGAELGVRGEEKSRVSLM